MEKINDGGPAFPCKISESIKRQSEAAGIYLSDHMGMTLRDKFADSALPALITDYFTGNRNNEYALVENWQYGLALDAYRIADAMLKAREVLS